MRQIRNILLVSLFFSGSMMAMDCYEHAVCKHHLGDPDYLNSTCVPISPFEESDKSNDGNPRSDYIKCGKTSDDNPRYNGLPCGRLLVATWIPCSDK